MTHWIRLAIVGGLLIVFGACQQSRESSDPSSAAPKVETEFAVEETSQDPESPVEQTSEATPPDGDPMITPGVKAPEFKLRDQNGIERSLAKLTENGDDVALVFYRSADW